MDPIYTPTIHREHIPDHFGGDMTHHLGLVLHVAQSDAASLRDYFAGTVAPNRKSATWYVNVHGRIEEYVPRDREAWAQADGNATYHSVETGGYSTTELTLLQVIALAFLMRLENDHYGVPLRVTNRVGGHGLGVHSMGGQAWGGHSCPGSLRANERGTIVAVADARTVEPHGQALRR
jgi:hypothetical protein